MNEESRTSSGRASMVRCSSGENEWFFFMSARYMSDATSGPLTTCSRRAGCSPNITTATFEMTNMQAVRTAARVPVARLGGLAVLAIAIPMSAPTPHEARPTSLSVIRARAIQAIMSTRPTRSPAMSGDPSPLRGLAPPPP
jgi:hypothetical protein